MNVDSVPIRNCHVATQAFYLCDKCLDLYKEYKDWNAVKDHAMKINLPQVTALSSRSRYITEAIYRLKSLTAEEILSYSSLNSDEKLMLLWIALCRCDRLACSFGLFLLNDFINKGKLSISKDDYRIFYSNLCDECEQFREFTEASIKKLRGWILNSAKQAAMIDSKHEIKRKFLSSNFISLIKQHDASDLLVLPVKF